MKILRTDPDRFGIRARLLTLLLPAIIGLLALDSWNDYRALKGLVQDAYDQTMLESVDALRNSLSIAPDGSLRLNAPFAAPSMHDATGQQHKHLHVGLTPRTPQGSLKGNAVARSGELNLLGEADLPNPPAQPIPPTSPSGVSPSTVWYDSYYRSYPVRVVALQSEIADGHGQHYDLLIQAAESTGPRDQAQATTLEQQLLRDARMVLVVIVLVWLGVTWSLQPLERLRKSVLQSKSNELKPLDTSDVPHEVAPLVDAVNQHLASYRDLLDQQSQFLADASHQLRTPLAIMMTQAGVALREKDPAQLHETLRAIVTQISRSRRLCEQLLSLAQASDSTPPADAPAIVDLNTIARDVVLQYLTLAHEKNQDLGWISAGDDAPPSPVLAQSQSPLVPVLAIGAELHEALANLVHNAIAYTPSGGRITVMVKSQNDMALAEVRDNGPGIAHAQRLAVFERFHQVSPGHGKGQHGAGLGLAIARAYARRNGGDIEFADFDADSFGSVQTPGSTGLRAILRLHLALL
ncbi:MAG: sensor histidine kinase [Polaromonas sp.]|nr:sensor histidine kinase [Polaromonas sp.]